MTERKKVLLDGMDREILRCIYKNPGNSTHQISKYVNLSPSSVTLRLKNLEKSGIVKGKSFGIKRKFNNSSPKILWSVDFEKVSKGESA